MTRCKPLLQAAACCTVVAAGNVYALPQPAAGLEDLSLEQLTEIHVTSVSRREERLASAPASIYVITADDIRRSGATSIVEALRLAPNLFVGRGDSNQAIIGARGQYAGTSNKMLVLVDGRTIYTPLFSGVFWDAQQFVLEDIDRIEVISGPAATLWGANGVNGVINITTRSARETQGTLALAFGGNDERGALVRHGGGLGGDASWRAYAKYRKTDARSLESGATARDEAERTMAGWRADWEGGARAATLQAEIFKADVDNLGGDRDLSGGHVQGRWTQSLASGSSLRVQGFWDHTYRRHAGTFEETLDILDVDAQHEYNGIAAHKLVSGAGYRHARDDVTNTPVLGFDPAHRGLWWANAFVQDEWTIAPRLQLTAGLKAERNPYTGTEWLPNVRFAWQTQRGHLLWGALSRALRTPSRLDREAFTPVLRTNTTFETEIADVAELGYRAQLSPQASFSVTVFHHRYPNLRSLDLTPDRTAVIAQNGFEGRMQGVEGWGTWRVAPWWRLSGGFTAMSETIRLKEGHLDVGGIGQISNDPRHTAQLRSSWDIGADWEADIGVRRVGHIPNFEIPAATVVDSRIAWRVSRTLELSFVANNLLDKDVVEFGTAAQRAVFDRSYFLKLRWQV